MNDRTNTEDPRPDANNSTLPRPHAVLALLVRGSVTKAGRLKRHCYILWHVADEFGARPHRAFGAFRKFDADGQRVLKAVSVAMFSLWRRGLVERVRMGLRRSVWRPTYAGLREWRAGGCP